MRSEETPRLRALLALARTGSVKSAAQLLGVTPSAISQQVGKLEDELEVPVVERHGRGFQLTAAGRAAVDAAERVESAFAELHRVVGRLRGEVSGSVVVGSFQTALRGVFVPMLDALRQRHPGITMSLREGDTAQIDGWLRDGEIDIAVYEAESDSGTLLPPGYEDVGLLDDPWVVVTAPGTPRPANLADLERYTWLDTQIGGANAAALNRIQLGRAYGTSLVHSYFEFSVALSLVADGQGTALLPLLGLIPPTPANLQVDTVPGLGQRHIVMRHPSAGVSDAARAVLGLAPVYARSIIDTLATRYR